MVGAKDRNGGRDMFNLNHVQLEMNGTLSQKFRQHTGKQLRRSGQTDLVGDKCLCSFSIWMINKT